MTDKEILNQLKDKLESKKRDLTDSITGKEYCDDPKCVKLELVNELLGIIQSNIRRPKFKEGDIITSDDGKDSCKITRLLDDAYEVTNDEIENDANQVSWIIKFEDQDNWRLVSDAHVHHQQERLRRIRERNHNSRHYRREKQQGNFRRNHQEIIRSRHVSVP